jgi:DinB superfamily
MTIQLDPRYPIGKFSPPTEESAALRGEQINAVRQLPAELRNTLSGLDDAQLDTPYREGGWTVRQVVHHLGDSHINSLVRFKLALTEDCPTIKPYNEAAWAQLPDSSLPVEGSLIFIESLHARWTALLDAMSDEDFKREFIHPEYGRQNLARTLAIYAWHGRHHTAHITALRQRQGW